MDDLHRTSKRPNLAGSGYGSLSDGAAGGEVHGIVVFLGLDGHRSHSVIVQEVFFLHLHVRVRNGGVRRRFNVGGVADLAGLAVLKAARSGKRRVVFMVLLDGFGFQEGP